MNRFMNTGTLMSTSATLILISMFAHLCQACDASDKHRYYDKRLLQWLKEIHASSARRAGKSLMYSKFKIKSGGISFRPKKEYTLVSRNKEGITLKKIKRKKNRKNAEKKNLETLKYKTLKELGIRLGSVIEPCDSETKKRLKKEARTKQIEDHMGLMEQSKREDMNGRFFEDAWKNDVGKDELLQLFEIQHLQSPYQKDLYGMNHWIKHLNDAQLQPAHEDRFFWNKGDTVFYRTNPRMGPRREFGEEMWNVARIVDIPLGGCEEFKTDLITIEYRYVEGGEHKLKKIRVPKRSHFIQKPWRKSKFSFGKMIKTSSGKHGIIISRNLIANPRRGRRHASLIREDAAIYKVFLDDGRIWDLDSEHLKSGDEIKCKACEAEPVRQKHESRENLRRRREKWEHNIKVSVCFCGEHVDHGKGTHHRKPTKASPHPRGSRRGSSSPRHRIPRHRRSKQ